jgi:hypothetical protein
MIDQFLQKAHKGSTGSNLPDAPSSLLTASKLAACAKRTVIRTFLASTKPVGTKIHGSFWPAKINGALI